MIQLKLSKLPKYGQKQKFFLHYFSHFFNFERILALQTAKIWFGMKFLIFWHPWRHVRSAWNKNWLHLTLWWCFCISLELKTWISASMCSKSTHQSTFWAFFEASGQTLQSTLIRDPFAQILEELPKYAHHDASGHLLGTFLKEMVWTYKVCSSESLLGSFWKDIAIAYKT